MRTSEYNVKHIDVGTSGTLNLGAWSPTMPDFFEIDFLSVHTSKSGDAIALRYEINGERMIHVVDGGYATTGPGLVAHIRKYYDNPLWIDHLVVTHPDQDHAEGVKAVIAEFAIGALWMLRPWMYAAELLYRFPTYSSAENLARKLRAAYPYISDLEQIALARGIQIADPFQGARIGAFTVLAPSRQRYLDLIVNSEKTPEGKGLLADAFIQMARRAANFVKSAWGHEVFSPDETSTENEMSVVQFSRLNDKKILLTADAGRGALAEAIFFAPFAGLLLPGIDRFQVPHHGGRRNVSTEILDALLGPRLAVKPAPGSEHFSAIISSAKEDEAHPRKAVVRAMIHRGAHVATTEQTNIRSEVNAPQRADYSPLQSEPYPEDQEE